MSERDNNSSLTRRNFVAGTAGLALASESALAEADERRIQLAAAHKKSKREKYRYNGPFLDFRSYIMALEERGLLIRFPKVDQDAFEATAIMYRLIDEYGWYEAPAILCEKLKIEGRWVEGPLIWNHQGHWYTEALVFGLDPVPNDGLGTYRVAMKHLEALLTEKVRFREIAPEIVSRDEAPCKDVVLTGDDIDITKFAFITTNPADGGRYVNTGSTFTSDPEMGYNFGTYRCQIRGPKVMNLNSEPGQSGWQMLMAARERGEKIAKVSIVVGQDPIVWMISGSRVAPQLKKGTTRDELAIAGGLIGQPLKVVKSETNDHLVPANVEMVIEGEVPLQEPPMDEGPFGEMYGYLGGYKEENFWFRITAITHRRNPWLLNVLTGGIRGYVTAPTAVLFNAQFRQFIPGFVEMYSPVDTTGIVRIKIKKTEPGHGVKAGKRASVVPLFKIIIVVDDDVDIYSDYEVGLAMAARYTPATSTEILDDVRGMPLDPSSSTRGAGSSKIVMDCTRQWPEEGGPEVYPKLNRTLFEELAPESFERVEAKWGDLLKRKLKTWP